VLLACVTSTGRCTTPDVSHPPIWFGALSSEGRRPKRDQRSRPSISSASLSAGLRSRAFRAGGG
jgi:hypothetical protein